MRAKLWAMVLVLVLTSLVWAASPATAEAVVRTPPYDFGCGPFYEPISYPGMCDVNWEPAVQGILDHVAALAVGIVYGPPFVWPTYYNFTSFTGIYLEITEANSQLDVAATYTGVQSAIQGNTVVCLGLFRVPPYEPRAEFCASGGSLSTSLSRQVSLQASGLQPGVYTLKVYARGGGYYGGGLVRVENITYESSGIPPSVGPPAAISVTPSLATMTAHPGVTYTATAAVTDEFGHPVSGETVNFEITSGPNVGNPGFCDPIRDCRTDTDGRMNWYFNSNGGSGTDNIRAFIDANSNGIWDESELWTSARIVWVAPQ